MKAPKPVADNRYDAPDDTPDYMLIGGRRVRAANRRVVETFDPATGNKVGEVPAATTADVDDAMACAKSALLGPWREASPAERGRVLTKIASRLRRESERFAIMETLDSGKPLAEARGDLATAAYYFEYYAGIADKLQGDSIPLGQNYMSFTVHEPVGVTSHIIPWNFPLMTTARGVAPALAAGNTAVVKPASMTPLTAIMLVELMEAEGLPAGVCNVLTGSGSELGAALTSHPEVSHVTFTGSVPTGQEVMKRAADTVASVTLELGGKSPVVVLADADLDSAVAGILKAIYMNAGQVCSAGSRLVIERRIHDVLMEKLVRATEGLSIGHGLDDPNVGPLISSEQRNVIARYVDGARERGIEVATGGRVVELENLEGGCFYAPTILDDVPESDVTVQEEIFGPVLAVQVVDSAEEAIAASNCTRFGLCAGIYTRNISEAMRFARDAEAGQVFINQYFAGGVATPFGGVKASGFGREKGLAALSSYYRVKCITTKI